MWTSVDYDECNKSRHRNVTFILPWGSGCVSAQLKWKWKVIIACRLFIDIFIYDRIASPECLHSLNKNYCKVEIAIVRTFVNAIHIIFISIFSWTANKSINFTLTPAIWLALERQDSTPWICFQLNSSRVLQLANYFEKRCENAGDLNCRQSPGRFLGNKGGLTSPAKVVYYSRGTWILDPWNAWLEG